MYYSGIDLHKRNAVITTLTTDGQLVESVTLSCSVQVLQRYFAQYCGQHRWLVVYRPPPLSQVPNAEVALEKIHCSTAISSLTRGILSA